MKNRKQGNRKLKTGKSKIARSVRPDSEAYREKQGNRKQEDRKQEIRPTGSKAKMLSGPENL
jgi:hypothetical protein